MKYGAAARGAGGAGRVSEEGVLLGGQAATEAIDVVEQEAIAIQGVEQQHGVIEDVVGEAIERRLRIIAEHAFDGGMGRAKSDEGSFGVLAQHLQGGELGAVSQDSGLEIHGVAPP